MTAPCTRVRGAIGQGGRRALATACSPASEGDCTASARKARVSCRLSRPEGVRIGRPGVRGVAELVGDALAPCSRAAVAPRGGEKWKAQGGAGPTACVPDASGEMAQVRAET